MTDGGFYQWSSNPECVLFYPNGGSNAPFLFILLTQVTLGFFLLLVVSDYPVMIAFASHHYSPYPAFFGNPVMNLSFLHNKLSISHIKISTYFLYLMKRNVENYVFHSNPLHSHIIFV